MLSDHINISDFSSRYGIARNYYVRQLLNHFTTVRMIVKRFNDLQTENQECKFPQRGNNSLKCDRAIQNASQGDPKKQNNKFCESTLKKFLENFESINLINDKANLILCQSIKAVCKKRSNRTLIQKLFNVPMSDKYSQYDNILIMQHFSQNYKLFNYDQNKEFPHCFVCDKKTTNLLKMNDCFYLLYQKTVQKNKKTKLNESECQLKQVNNNKKYKKTRFETFIQQKQCHVNGCQLDHRNHVCGMCGDKNSDHLQVRCPFFNNNKSCQVEFLRSADPGQNKGNCSLDRGFESHSRCSQQIDQTQQGIAKTQLCGARMKFAENTFQSCCCQKVSQQSCVNKSNKCVSSNKQEFQIKEAGPITAPTETFKVPCPNKCSQGFVQQTEMSNHRKKCSREMIKCVFCRQDRYRGQLIAHTKLAHSEILNEKIMEMHTQTVS